ncbi:GNAT family N-acetyltransferase [Evansella sp. AB-rgal1]|uniref:GNAT family N-acetyltransferase n=1 Tax=Evansella sp. AB-rgal1 TaxID=3242696 RepID=UPI00359D6B9A
MDIQLYTSPTDVLNKVEKCLMEKEAENNLPLGLLRRLKVEEEKNILHMRQEKPHLLLVMKDDGEPGFMAIQTPPFNLVICGEEQYSEHVVNWLLDRDMSFPGVVGCKPTVDAFANAWQKRTDCKLKTFMRQRIYRLEDLKEVPKKKGRLCYATEDDLAIVTHWTQLFYEESLEPIDRVTAENFVKSEINRNAIFLWRNEECIPVSMAKRARESENGVVVSLVYTPDEYKRQGYATTCVAALSEWLLKEGFQFCSLYTDLDNPTSNSIYMKIGYEQVADSVEYRFIYNKE